MANEPTTQCERCDVLAGEVSQLRDALSECSERQRLVVVSTLIIAGMSLIAPATGWLGSAYGWASTSDVWGFIYYGVFFATTWAIPILIGVLVFAMPGSVAHNLMHGFLLFATALTVWSLERLVTLDGDLSDWLQRMGPAFAVVVIGYSLTAFAGLSLDGRLNVLPRRRLSVWMLMALTALSGVVVRLLQVEEDFGIELLILCLSTFIACGIQGVVIATWSTMTKYSSHWKWLSISVLVAPLSPALHPEAHEERFEYAVFGCSVWAVNGLLLTAAFWGMRQWTKRKQPKTVN